MMGWQDEPLPEPFETIVQWFAVIVAAILMGLLAGWLRPIVEPYMAALVRWSGLF